jgi:hypothetical protein
MRWPEDIGDNLFLMISYDKYYPLLISVNKVDRHGKLYEHNVSSINPCYNRVISVNLIIIIACLIIFNISKLEGVRLC